MKAVLNNEWLIYSKDIDILIELLTSDSKINWHNFGNGSYFYSDNCKEYQVDGITDDEKSLILVRCE